MVSDRRQDGFTLVEVLAASVILMIGIQGALLGISAAQEGQRKSIYTQEATQLAERVASTLLTNSTNDACSAGTVLSDLLRDLQQQIPRSAQLLCFGPNCTPDYPRAGSFQNDLRQALASETSDGGSLPIRVRVPGSNYPDWNADHEVLYEGHAFRVNWNVICNMPIPGSQRVAVLVTWPPYTTAIAEGRFVQLEFQKGNGF